MRQTIRLAYDAGEEQKRKSRVSSAAPSWCEYSTLAARCQMFVVQRPEQAKEAGFADNCPAHFAGVLAAPTPLRYRYVANYERVRAV